MTKSILAAVPLLFCLTTAPVFAEQILYCADTEVGGFKWDKSGAASVRKFTASRYIVKVEPATEYGLKQLRVITDTTADNGAGSPRQYKCRPNFLRPGVWGDAAASRAERWPVPDVSSSALVCDSGDGAEPWMFFGNTIHTRDDLWRTAR
jgi:hypothetical protein